MGERNKGKAIFHEAVYQSRKDGHKKRIIRETNDAVGPLNRGSLPISKGKTGEAKASPVRDQ